jgi:hypothetical protein
MRRVEVRITEDFMRDLLHRHHGGTVGRINVPAGATLTLCLNGR